jgi:hypothetical protein
MNFARYIAREKLKRKYSTNQISKMWASQQYLKYGGKLIKDEKLSTGEVLDKVKGYLKYFFKRGLVR